MANVVIIFWPDDNPLSYPSNWCDQPPAFRLMGDSEHCNSWDEMSWGYYLYRNGVEVGAVARRTSLAAKGRASVRQKLDDEFRLQWAAPCNSL